MHLTSARVKCVSVLRVDLSVRRWYQKQAGLVGVLPILGRGLRFFAECFTLRGELRGAELAGNWIVADFLSTRIDLTVFAGGV